MFNLPETHFHFGGDEYIYAEISREMRIESNFKALAITKELRKKEIPGVVDIVSANSSYLVRYNPDIISAKNLLDCLKDIDLTKSDPKKLHFSARIIEIPAWYDDPVSRECSYRFRNRNPEPELSNFEFVMKANHFADKEEFIEYHSGTPYLITMVGFLPGTAWHFPLGQEPFEVLQAPKYHSPRTETPERCIGTGGAFNVIYPVNGPGSYQLIGRAAVPMFDPKGQLTDLKETAFLARPGDIWKYRPVNESEYHQIMREVEAGEYRLKIKEFTFSPLEYMEKGKQYIREFMEDF
ncbi:allophanate hydrolase subunit 1 [Neobacillus mesonae]|uniref:5-oxoprolinase subunit B family protein n=1 Tax=Neobacillus mesonae TaxID=1193713 RepID=UPI002041739A|nr:carboxyltransferase domain-containing protein [Neobacillus mesonae]MCM3568650.1 carboxyltransferase domain-containing protein [Neobacillus mesonae]